jgi:ABC-2 type transport system permease protein
VLVASRLKRMESFQVVMQFLMMPMLFLSGALFPLQGLPTWLAAITKVNPVTYAVDPVRRIVMQAQDLPPVVTARFGAGVELFGRVLPIGVEILVTTVFALVFLALAIAGFARTE